MKFNLLSIHISVGGTIYLCDARTLYVLYEIKIEKKEKERTVLGNTNQFTDI